MGLVLNWRKGISCHSLSTQQRIRIYNDFAIDVDVLQGMMTELRRFLAKATGHYEEFHNRYIKACGKLVKAINDLQFRLSTNPVEDMDTDDLRTVLNQIDTNGLITALRTRELPIVHDMVGEIQAGLQYLLRPDFSRYQSANNLHQDCEDANREYKSLVNSNIALSASIAALNDSLHDRLSTFSEKLKLLKGIEA